MTLFNKLYGHYKDNFDLELSLTAGRKTYKQLAEESFKEELWI